MTSATAMPVHPAAPPIESFAEVAPAQRHEVHVHSPLQRVIEASAIGVFFVLVAVLAVRLGGVVVSAPAQALTIAVALGVGYLLGDLASGLVHFTFDRFFTTSTPWLGTTFVTLFRQHHSDPKDITRHGFIETNGNNSLATLPLLIGLLFVDLVDDTGPMTSSVFAVATALWTSLAVFGTNQFHKWAHDVDVPPVIDWLQRHHVILPKDHHQTHHTFPYNTHYCITTGWLNAPLSAIGFWARLEWVLARVVRLPHFVETTPWEQIAGTPAFQERQEILGDAAQQQPAP